MTIWRMRIACWIPKSSTAHSEYVTRIVFPLKHWLYERAALLLYTYIACIIYKLLTALSGNDPK